VRVRTPQATELRDALAGPDVVVTASERDVLEVRGLSSEQIGEAAGRSSIVLYELTPQKASLEDAFMDLTGESVEYHAGDPATVGSPELKDAA
jgi:ABC-2 type transport system ATP-binding protein